MCSFVSSDRAFEFDPKTISLIFHRRILKKIISNDILFFAFPCSVPFSFLVLSSLCLRILLSPSLYFSFLLFPLSSPLLPLHCFFSDHHLSSFPFDSSLFFTRYFLSPSICLFPLLSPLYFFLFLTTR